MAKTSMLQRSLALVLFCAERCFVSRGRAQGAAVPEQVGPLVSVIGSLSKSPANDATSYVAPDGTITVPLVGNIPVAA